MAVKQRAVAVADKEERRNAILDAAEALFNEQPSRVANVAEVAETAGLAKGTVYLYFPARRRCCWHSTSATSRASSRK